MAYTESASAELRDIAVDWEALEDAFENNASEVHSYLHLATGEVLRVVDGIADPELHSKIAESSSYLRIEPVSSREQYGWMERFIPMVEEEDLCERLLDAIDGKGAFRRFKDVLMSWPEEREKWFAFRSERVRVFMESWLAANGLSPTAREPRTSEIRQLDPDEGHDGPAVEITQAELSGVKPPPARSELDSALMNAVEILGVRDLEKVLSFAEFVKARSAGSRGGA